MESCSLFLDPSFQDELGSIQLELLFLFFFLLFSKPLNDRTVRDPIICRGRLLFPAKSIIVDGFKATAFRMIVKSC